MNGDFFVTHNEFFVCILERKSFYKSLEHNNLGNIRVLLRSLYYFNIFIMLYQELYLCERKCRNVENQGHNHFK